MSGKVTEAAQDAGRSFDRTVAGLKNGVDAATSAAEQAQGSMREGMAKAVHAAGEMLSFGQGNVEAAMRSGQILASAMQDLSRQAAATAQAQADEAMSTIRALAGVRSVKDAFDLQASFARSGMERMVAESGRMADASFKLWEQAWAPLGQRVTAAAERFGRTA